jgi:uncharacterized protein RhaS with RHS repeats
LHYNLARYYDPAISRWAAADSVTAQVYDPQALNKYAYVRNDPINSVDPDGRLPANIRVEGGWRCVPTGFVAGLGFVDASNPCPPGFIMSFNIHTTSSYSRLQQIFDVFEALGSSVVNWDYANESGTLFNVLLDEGTTSALQAYGYIPALATAGGGVIILGGPVSWTAVGAAILITGASLAALKALDMIIKQTRIPTRGQPNSTVTYPTPKGRTVREYGSDGRAVKDIDYGHDHTGAGDPHVHHWDWSSGSPVRGPETTPNPGEIP